MGGLGIVVSFIWLKVIYSPVNHPSINPSELEYIKQGGGLVLMGEDKNNTQQKKKTSFADIKQLLSSRMLLGIFIAQYCINCLTYFFLT